MTTTRTSDIGATLQQIAELTASGCQIVRVACPTQDDADALSVIAKKSQIPVIADIHFQPKYVFAAIEAGCAAVRVNPGNIKQFDDKVKEIAKAARDHGTPIRIGVNAGSLDRRLLQSTARRPPRRSRSPPCGRRLSSRSTTSGTSRSPSSTTTRSSWSRPTGSSPPSATTRCTSVSPRPVPPSGHHQVGRRLRRPALPGHRRHHPGLPVGPADRGNQGRHPDPGVAQPAPARPGDRLLPVLRPRPGRRLQAGRGGHRRPGGHGRPLRVAVMG